MTEKKIHWKTAQKLAKQNGADIPTEIKSELVETTKEETKTSWTVLWTENGADKQFTYYLDETPEAEVNAAKLALKKGGKII